MGIMLSGGDDLAAMQPGAFWAKITGNAAGTNRYSWEQIDTGDTAAFDVGLADGFAATGTTAATGACAYEVNGRTDIATDTRVLLYPAGDLTYYLFAAPATGGGSATVSFASSYLASDYAITADATWEDVGVSVSLPAAGKYMIWGLAHCGISVSDFSGGTAAMIEFRLKLTSAVLVDPAGFLNVEVARTTVVDEDQGGSAYIMLPIEISGSTTLKMQASRWVPTASGSPTWTTAVIRSATSTSSDYGTGLGYHSIT